MNLNMQVMHHVHKQNKICSYSSYICICGRTAPNIGAADDIIHYTLLIYVDQSISFGEKAQKQRFVAVSQSHAGGRLLITAAPRLDERTGSAVFYKATAESRDF